MKLAAAYWSIGSTALVCFELNRSEGFTYAEIVHRLDIFENPRCRVPENPVPFVLFASSEESVHASRGEWGLGVTELQGRQREIEAEPAGWAHAYPR